jgi:hypothetical protein
MSEKCQKKCQKNAVCLTFFYSVYHLKPSSAYDKAAYRFFSSGGPLLTHVSKACCSCLSCVSLVHRSSFIFERNLPEMIPPCGFNSPKHVLRFDTRVSECLWPVSVSEILTQKQATKTNCHHFCWPSLTFNVSICSRCLPRCHDPPHPMHLIP